MAIYVVEAMSGSPRVHRWGPTRGVSLSLSPRASLLSQTASHLAFGESHHCPLSQLRCPQEGDDGLVYRLVLVCPLAPYPEPPYRRRRTRAPPARAEHSLCPPHTDIHSGHTHSHTLTGLRRVGTLRVYERECASARGEDAAAICDVTAMRNSRVCTGGVPRGASLSLSPRAPLLSQGSLR